jgi:hypothetical protein
MIEQARVPSRLSSLAIHKETAATSSSHNDDHVHDVSHVTPKQTGSMLFVAYNICSLTLFMNLIGGRRLLATYNGQYQKYVELVLFNDNARYVQRGSNTPSLSKSIINQVYTLYNNYL